MSKGGFSREARLSTILAPCSPPHHQQHFSLLLLRAVVQLKAGGGLKLVILALVVDLDLEPVRPDIVLHKFRRSAIGQPGNALRIDDLTGFGLV